MRIGSAITEDNIDPAEQKAVEERAPHSRGSSHEALRIDEVK
jgi:hypothetical protein